MRLLLLPFVLALVALCVIVLFIANADRLTCRSSSLGPKGLS